MLTVGMKVRVNMIVRLSDRVMMRMKVRIKARKMMTVRIRVTMTKDKDEGVGYRDNEGEDDMGGKHEGDS